MENTTPAVAAVNLNALKDDLIDAVSAFLLKEPPMNQDPPQPRPADKDGAPPSASSTVPASPRVGPSPTTALPLETTARATEAVDVSPVSRIRQLVHAISQQDGEFVLKLALYVRHDLRLRNTANFLTALCGREAKCAPYLEGYMEKAVVLPSDWLAVATFAYYFDNNTNHGDLAEPELSRPPQQHQQQADGAAIVSPHYSLPSSLRRALVARFQGFNEFSLAKYNNENALKHRKYKAKARHNRLQAAQRKACKAAKQNEAKDNARNKEAHDAVVDLHALFRLEASPSPAKSPAKSRDGSGSEGVALDVWYDDDDEDEDEDEDENDEEAGATAPFVFPRERTFTYKQLVRLLHIDTPAYLVCCLLGKRYPNTFEQFTKMQLDRPTPGAPSSARSHRFDASLAGTRMRLHVPETWETELAKFGNTGATWDRLFARNAVPFMAMLRNLRNVLTRNVSEATHQLILSRLASEEEVAASAQMPHRFLSALYSVEGVLVDYKTTGEWLERSKERADPTRQHFATLEGRVRGRGPGRPPSSTPVTALRPPLKPLPFPKMHTMHGKVHACEQPLSPLSVVEARVAQYTAALNLAVGISQRLNVQPLPGSALVVLCIWPSMRETFKAVGGGSVGSLRTKLQLAVLLAVTVKQSAEDGTVLVMCHDTVKLFHTKDFASNNLLSNVMELTAVCEAMLNDHVEKRRVRMVLETPTDTSSDEKEGCSAWSVPASHASTTRHEGQEEDWAAPKTPRDTRTGAKFPFFYLDEIIERRLPLESLVVIDEGHHTYGCMNTDAPSLGDLPVYLNRLRHTSSPHLVFLAVSTSSPSSAVSVSSPYVAGLSTMVTIPAAQRYGHRNDLVLTGFSDALLRLIAERAQGGPRPYIERADEVFQVQRFAGHHRQRIHRAQLQHTVDAIRKAEQHEQHRRASHVQAAGVVGPGEAYDDSQLALLQDGNKGVSCDRSSAFTASGTPGLTPPLSMQGRTSATTAAAAPQPSLKLFAQNGLGVLTKNAEAALYAPRSSTTSPATLWTSEAQKGADVMDIAPTQAAPSLSSSQSALPVIYRPLPGIVVSKAPQRAGAEGKRLLAQALQNIAKQQGSPTSTATTVGHATLSFIRTTEMTASEPYADPCSALTARTPQLALDNAVPRSYVPRPLSSYHECRFFISSTFLDMNNERNALTLDVFPRLRRWVADRGLRVNLLEMDLRWGITEAATNEHLSTSVCLNNVSRCAPFFIGMLGDRYGSCPSPLSIVVDEDVPMEDFAWMSTLPGSPDVAEVGTQSVNGAVPTVKPEVPQCSVSVTELEMRHGVYTSRRRLQPSSPPATVFFCRDRATLARTLPKDERQRVYAPDTPTSIPRIERLKAFLMAEGVPVINYKAGFVEGTRASGVGIGGDPASGGASAGRCDGAAGATGVTHGDLSESAAMDAELRNTWAHRSPSTIPSYIDFIGQHNTACGNGNGAAAAGRAGSSSVASSAALAGGAQPFLTSQDVLLDMTEFTRKAFFALRAIIAHVCGVSLDEWIEANDDHSGVEEGADDAEEETLSCASERTGSRKPQHARSTPVAEGAPSTTRQPLDFHASQEEAQRIYMAELCRVYVPPPHLVEQLAGFALQGAVPTLLIDEDTAEATRQARQRAERTKESWELSADAESTGSPAAEAQAAIAGELGLEMVARGQSHVLVLTGPDGDGKSSAMAGLAQQLQQHEHEGQTVIYYALQADGSHSMQLQALVLYLASALVRRAGLEDEIVVDASEPAGELVQSFPQIYRDINKRGDMNVVVLIDAPEKCLDAEALVQQLGWIINPSAAPAVRFILATTPSSPFAEAFSSRIPPAIVCRLPVLPLPERADLVRRHLGLYGKVLQETMDLNELNALLHKRDARHPSYLIAAILYLRLFSTFDTLREDMRQLPTTIGALYRQFFASLETQFDHATCRLVLTTLCLRQSAGGVMEHTLYRLVANVAVASRLVDLLSTTGLTSSRRSGLTLRSSFFATAIANTYFATTADAVAARECLVLAELLYQPLRSLDDLHHSRLLLRRLVESIKLSATDLSAPRLFFPARYASHELMSILQDAAHACRADIVLALVGYLPFLESLLEDTASVGTDGRSKPLAASAFAQSASPSHGSSSGSPCRRSHSTDSMRLTQLMGILMPLCEHRSTSVTTTAQSLVHFFQLHHQSLQVRPCLLVQCVRNMPPGFRAISRYSSADYLHWGREKDRTAVDAAAGVGLQTFRAGSAVATAASASVGLENGDEGAALDRLLLCLRARRQTAMVTTLNALANTPQGNAHHHHSGLRADTHHKSIVTQVALADGNTAAGDKESGEGDVWVRWGNVEQHGTGMRESSFRPAASQPVLCLSVSTDGSEIALGYPDGYARVAPASAPQHLKASLKHVAAVTALTFLASRANTLVTGCEKGLVYVWSLEDNSLLQVGAAHLRRVSSIAAHPFESCVCTGSHDSHAMLWDVLGTVSTTHSLLNAAAEARGVRGGAHQQALQLTRRGPGGVPTNRFGALVLTGGRRTPLYPFHVLRHHQAAVSCVAFHRNGEVLATASWDGIVFLVDLSDVARPHTTTTTTTTTNEAPPGTARTELIFASLRFPVASPARVVRFAPSMVVTCAVGTYTGSISLVDFASGLESSTLTHLHHAPVSALSFSPDGKLLASADVKGQLCVSYAGVTGTVLTTLNGHHDAITGLAFTTANDTNLLMSVGMDRTLQTWRVEAASTASEVPASHAASVTCVAVASDASVYITGSADGTAFVFRRKAAEGNGSGMRAVYRDASPQGRPATRGQQQTQCDGDGDVSSRQRERSCPPENDSEYARTAPLMTTTADVYEPFMSLQHDGWRVTSIAFALVNTRFITGVASGDVYVWSSQPGLSRREGHLLLRVAVPRQGIYPVVAIEANDLVTGITVLTEAGRGTAKTMTAQGDIETTTAALPATTSRVTALCSNGDSVHVNVYTSRVSLAMQRQQQHAREAEDDHAADVMTHESDLAWLRTPTAASSPALPQKATSAGLDTSASRAGVTSSSSNNNSSDTDESATSDAVGQVRGTIMRGRLHAPRRANKAAEKVHCVHRQRLQWRAQPQPPLGTTSPPPPHMPTDAAVPVWLTGEELIASIPLTFYCEPYEPQRQKQAQAQVTSRDTSRPHSASSHSSQRGVTEHEEEEEAGAAAEALQGDPPFSWAGANGREGFLHVASHDALVVGRRHFFLVSFKRSIASVLAVAKLPSLVWSDQDFHTAFHLVEGETLVAVTDCCYVPSARRHVLCAASDRGRLFFFCLGIGLYGSLDHARLTGTPPQSGTALTAPTHADSGTATRATSPQPQPHFAHLWLWCTTTLTELSTSSSAASRPTQVLEHGRPEYGLVDTLALAVTTKPPPADVAGVPAPEEGATLARVERALEVVVGCRDGSTRVLAMPIDGVRAALGEVADAEVSAPEKRSYFGADSASTRTPSPPPQALSQPRTPTQAARTASAVHLPPGALSPSSPSSYQTSRSHLAVPPPSRATMTTAAPTVPRSAKMSAQRQQDPSLAAASVPSTPASNRDTPPITVTEHAVFYASAPLKALAVLPRSVCSPQPASPLAETASGTFACHAGSCVRAFNALSSRASCLTGSAPLQWIAGDDVGNVYRLHVEDAEGRWAREVESAHDPLSGKPAPVLGAASTTTMTKRGGSATLFNTDRHPVALSPYAPLALMEQQAHALNTRLALTPFNMNSNLARDVASSARSADVHMPAVPRTASSMPQQATHSGLSGRGTDGQAHGLFSAIAAPLGVYAATHAHAGLGTQSDLSAGAPLWRYLHGLSDHGTDGAMATSFGGSSAFDARPTAHDFAVNPFDTPLSSLFSSATTTRDVANADKASAAVRGDDGEDNRARGVAVADDTSAQHGTDPAALDASVNATTAPDTAHQNTAKEASVFADKLAALRKEETDVTALFLKPPSRREMPAAAAAAAVAALDDAGGARKRPEENALGDAAATARATTFTTQPGPRDNPLPKAATNVADTVSSDEVSYFQPLIDVHPPPDWRGSAEKKRAWYAHRQVVLKEAMRVKSYNKEAREALKTYERQVTAALQL